MSKKKQSGKPLREPIEQHTSVPISGELQVKIGEDIYSLTFQMWKEAEKNGKDAS